MTWSPKQPAIPMPMTVTTGEESSIQVTTDQFFQSVLDFLGYDQRAAASFAQVDIRALDRSVNNLPPRPTDDAIVLLVVCDELVASVIHRRDDYNRVQAFFALYLSNQTTERVRWHPD